MKTNYTPQLRFQEFTDEWQEKKLGDITDINPKISKLPKKFIYIDLDSVNSGIITKTIWIKKKEAPSRAQRLLKQNDIIYQTVRPYQRNNYFFDKNNSNHVASTGYAQIRTKNNAKFIYYLLHTDNFVNKVSVRSTGTNYPAINSNDLKKIKIKLPTKHEQQKIAGFLGSVDEKIEKLEKKEGLFEKYKKCVMQKIFSQEIRFKDKNGNPYLDWEEKKIGDFLIQINKRNKNDEVNLVLSVNNKLGFITQKEQFDGHSVASTDLKNYKIVQKDEYAYNPSRINVGSLARLKNGRGIVSPMYIVFKTKNSLNNLFFDNLFQTHYFKYLIKIGCSGSVRDSLNYNDLASFKIKFPIIEEQKKNCRIFNFIR